MPVNWYRNYWIHNGLKIVNSQRFPFDYHKANSGKYKISLRGEPLLSSDEESGTEIDDKGDECVEEKRKLSPSPHVTDIRSRSCHVSGVLNICSFTLSLILAFLHPSLRAWYFVCL
jgi:hypothetical protein